MLKEARAVGTEVKLVVNANITIAPRDRHK